MDEYTTALVLIFTLWFALLVVLRYIFKAFGGSMATAMFLSRLIVTAIIILLIIASHGISLAILSAAGFVWILVMMMLQIFE